MNDPGKVSESVFRRCVEKRLYHLPAGEGAICQSDRFSGRFEAAGLQLASASAAEEGPDAMTGASAFYQAVAYLAAAGALPLFVTLDITADRACSEKELHQICDGAGRAAQLLGLSVLQSDIRYLSCSGQGRAMAAARALGMADAAFEPERARPGQALIMAGCAGWHGSLKLADIFREKILSAWNEDFAAPLLYPQSLDQYFLPPADGRQGEGGLFASAALAAQAGIRAMHAPGEGGIFTGIWDFAARARLGVRIFLDRIPIRQETVEVCDLLGVNPYLLMSQGTLLMAADEEMRILEEFAAAAIPAAVIGYFTDGSDRVVINDGETRFLEPFRGDSFYKAFKKDEKQSLQENKKSGV